MEYLTEDEIIEINRQIILEAGQGLISLIDPKGLNSVVESPKQVFFDREAYPTVWLKSAYYLQKITKKHLFADGNKRTALEAAKVFLLLNDVHIKFQGIEAGKMVLDITTAPDSENVMIKIARFLRDHQVNLNKR